jgi:hypothetical protein
MKKPTEQQNEERESLPAGVPIGMGVYSLGLAEDRAVLAIDLRGDFGPTNSGKSNKVAELKGKLPGTDLNIMMVVYRKHPKPQPVGKRAAGEKRSPEADEGSTTGAENEA